MQHRHRHRLTKDHEKPRSLATQVRDARKRDLNRVEAPDRVPSIGDFK